MTPTIPFEFEPCASDFQENHLVYEDEAGGQRVSWPAANVSIFVPEHEFPAHPGEIEKSNGDYFRMHGVKGFSAGIYTELLLEELPGFLALKMNSDEVSFGQASPLAAYIFNFVHREKYFGPWESICTARILGVQHDQAELAFLNACTHYSERFGIVPKPNPMDESFIWWEEPEHAEPITATVGPPCKDLDPLRFYYYGLRQADNTAACIYFFRTLEYFSFLMNQSKLSKLRHDHALSEAEFAKRVLDLVTKEEKGPLLQLVNQIADKAVIEKAFSDGLIQSKTGSALGEAIYTLRNSLVHGKLSYGYTLLSSSVIDDDKDLPPRRAILQRLARKAIEPLARR